MNYREIEGNDRDGGVFEYVPDKSGHYTLEEDCRDRPADVITSYGRVITGKFRPHDGLSWALVICEKAVYAIDPDVIVGVHYKPNQAL